MITRRESLTITASALAASAVIAPLAAAQSGSAATSPPPEAFKGKKLYITPQTGGTLRREGTSGDLAGGFWRTHANAPRCRTDGSCSVGQGSIFPWNDAALILEGTGTITIPSTGTKVSIEPGMIFSHPWGIETRWDIDAPYLKKFALNWAGTTPHTNHRDIIVGNINDNPTTWKASSWAEARGTTQTLGESYLVREDRSPDTMLVGVWRAGVGIAGGSSVGQPVTYSGTSGDLSFMLVEGQMKVRNEETGEEHEIKAGDAVGLSAGLRTTWSLMTPFVKTFFVATRDAPSRA